MMLQMTLSARPQRVGVLICLLGLTMISVWYFNHTQQKFATYQLRYNTAKHMTTADSNDYRLIAYAFANGDYSLSHFGSLRSQEAYPFKSSEAHRHPLYPLLLSVAWRLFGGELRVLASVNILLNIATMWLVFLLVRQLFGSLTAAGLSALTVPYLLWLSNNAALKLMTEPLFVLLMLVNLYFCARFAVRPESLYFYVAIAFSALCYLTRINGLIVFLSTALVSTAFLIANWFNDHDRQPFGRLGRRIAGMLAGALALFVLLTSPVWLAKWTHTGNPLFHRYQQTALWATSRDEFKDVDPRQINWRSFLRQSSWQDITHRLGVGFKRVFLFPGEFIGRKFYLLALCGLGLGLALRDRRVLAIAGVTALSVSPLVWTNLVIPTLRIPFTVLTPAYVLFIGFLVYSIQHWGSQLLGRRMGRPDPPGASA